MEKLIFDLLKANDIDCRVGTANAKGFTLLLYKDARCDMNALDNHPMIGAARWQRKHYVCKDNLYCSVGIKLGDEWIWKDDCGTESYAEKEKGEASDSFKRACFNWGIGRELYTSPFIWIEGGTCEKGGKYFPEYQNFRVDAIDHKDGVISALTISANKPKEKREVIFEYPKSFNKSQDERRPASKTAPDEMTLAFAQTIRTPKGTLLCKLSEDDLILVKDTAKDETLRAAAKVLLDEMFLSLVDPDCPF